MSVQAEANRFRENLIETDIEEISDTKTLIKYLIEVATLAPSTHNTQPWKLVVTGLEKITVTIDTDKALPQSDAENRDLFISFGALIENFSLLGEATGLLEVQELNKNEFGYEARVLVNRETTRNIDKNILKGIIQRQNFRGFMEPLKDNQIEEVRKTIKKSTEISKPRVWAYITDDSNIISELADITSDGLKEAHKSKLFRNELTAQMNGNQSTKRTGLHGYSLRLKGPFSYLIPFLAKRVNLSTLLSKLNKNSFNTASAVVVLSSEDDKLSWISVGRVLQRTLVGIQSLELTASIYVAGIEIGNLYEKINQIIKAKEKHKGRPQMLFCVGLTNTPMPYSVREPIANITVFD